MTAPGLTYAEFLALNPCRNGARHFTRAVGGPWGERKITVADARNAGAVFSEIIWVLSRLDDADVQRRLRLFAADCAARVLHLYEADLSAVTAPRDAIIAARKTARGEINDASDQAAAAARAVDAAWATAAWDAAAWADARADAAARAAAWAAVDAAWYATWAAASAADAAARAAAWAAAQDTARAAERAWQFDRLVERFSDNEPDDWPLPKLPERLRRVA